MIAVDTNVLVRALIDDESAPGQSAAARALLEDVPGPVGISTMVFTETLWVLAKRYGVSRQRLVAIANDLLGHQRLGIQDRERLSEAIGIYAGSAVDFADALALVDARIEGAVLHTFDRKLSRLDGAILVSM